MSKPLPYSNLKWVSDSTRQRDRPKTIEDWLSYINTKMYGIGKIYEVDLEYPSELRHLHNDYPCAAQKIKVTDARRGQTTPQMFHDFLGILHYFALLRKY